MIFELIIHQVPVLLVGGRNSLLLKPFLLGNALVSFPARLKSPKTLFTRADKYFLVLVINLPMTTLKRLQELQQIKALIITKIGTIGMAQMTVAGKPGIKTEAIAATP